MTCFYDEMKSAETAIKIRAAEQLSAILGDS
jgi:hypothetical protein